MNYDILTKAACYTLVCILAFHFGALYAIYKKYITDSDNYIISERGFYKIRLFGIIIIILSSYFYFQDIINSYKTALLYGYAGVYKQEANRVVELLSAFFTPGVLLVFYTSLKLKRHLWIITVFAFITTVLPPLLIGGRSNAVIILAIYGILYVQSHKIGFKRFSILALSAYVLILVLNIVGSVRQNKQNNIDSYVNAFEQQQSQKEDPIIETLQEMGWSMYPLAIQIKYMPERHDYMYGTSYFWSLFSLVPNLGFWDIHPSRTNEAQGIAQSLSGFNYGIGYSLIAESFINWGYFGFILMFLFGFFYVKIFSMINKRNFNYKPALFIVGMLFLLFSIKGVRNSSLNIVRYSFYYILPIYFIVKYTCKKYKIKDQ